MDWNSHLDDTSFLVEETLGGHMNPGRYKKWNYTSIAGTAAGTFVPTSGEALIGKIIQSNGTFTITIYSGSGVVTANQLWSSNIVDNDNIELNIPVTTGFTVTAGGAGSAIITWNKP